MEWCWCTLIFLDTVFTFKKSSLGKINDSRILFFFILSPLEFIGHAPTQQRPRPIGAGDAESVRERSPPSSSRRGLRFWWHREHCSRRVLARKAPKLDRRTGAAGNPTPLSSASASAKPVRPLRDEGKRRSDAASQLYNFCLWFISRFLVDRHILRVFSTAAAFR